MKKIIIILSLFLACPGFGQNDNSKSGLLPPTKAYIDSLPLFNFKPKGIANLPSSIDLSNNMPVPGDQGNQGSCAAWTTGYALKSFHERIEEMNPNLVMSPSFIYNQLLSPSDNCDSGIYFEDALDFLKDKGIVELKDFRYDESDCKTKPSPKLIAQAKKYRIASWNLVYSYFDKTGFLSVNGVKSQLANGNPIVCGVWLDNAFWNDTYGDRSKNRFVWKNPKNDLPLSNSYHAMLCVGYDDSINAFKFMNSYGTSFGNDGFAWISYDAFKKRTLEAYVTLDQPNGKSFKVSSKISDKEHVQFAEETLVYESWLKSGYYNRVNDIKISAVYVSKQNKEAIFRIYYLSYKEEILIGSFKLKTEDAYEFKYEDKTYRITLDNIGAAGINFFKPAAFFKFEELQLIKN